MKAAKKHHVDAAERARLTGLIASGLEANGAVLFAYVYGSFIEGGGAGFNDIDVAVCLDDSTAGKDSLLDRQLDLSVTLGRQLGRYEVDCRVLNNAPLSFRFFAVNGGEPVFSRDEARRIEFEVRTRSLYYDFWPHAEFYYRKIVLREG
ncbi:MAG: nucleotidyltransferase domain-containing protein [Deltaproteobacteria bacterium]|nr:nucleotidyltransferase domain-containing protein [Deltaproteobacteria bacterium]